MGSLAINFTCIVKTYSSDRLVHRFKYLITIEDMIDDVIHNITLIPRHIVICNMFT